MLRYVRRHLAGAAGAAAARPSILARPPRPPATTAAAAGRRRLSVAAAAGRPKFVLAIDNGTTSSRAILFNHRGTIAAMDQIEFTQHYPHAGWCEHDPSEILSSVLKCCRDVLAKAGASKSDVACVGITNQRETTVAWDAETGEPLCNALVWLDLRTAKTAEDLCHAGGQDRFRSRTGLPVSTYFSAVKMKWMMENNEAVRSAVVQGRCRFGTVESWLIYQLTGGRQGGVHLTDVSNASRYMLMNIEEQQWDESVCREVGVPLFALPEIRSNAEIYGHVKGHGELDGLPISGALGDQHAALLGQGCLEPGESKITYGTGCFTLINVGKKPVPSTHGLLTTIGFRLGPEAETSYALEGSVACAGRTVQWLRDSLGLVSSAHEIEAIAASVPDTGGVTFVPAFSGLFAPHWRSDARAVVVGMTLFTSKAHLCRAALEGVAFQNAEVLGAMQKDTGMDLAKVRADGGMTANTLLMQMQADLLNQTVMRAQMPEATALGAAFAAGLTTGFWEDVADVRHLIAEAGGHNAFTPAMDEEKRKVAHARWADAVGRTLSLEVWGEE